MILILLKSFSCGFSYDIYLIMILLFVLAEIILVLDEYMISIFSMIHIANILILVPAIDLFYLIIECIIKIYLSFPAIRNFFFFCSFF